MVDSVRLCAACGMRVYIEGADQYAKELQRFSEPASFGIEIAGKCLPPAWWSREGASTHQPKAFPINTKFQNFLTYVEGFAIRILFVMGSPTS